MAKTNTVLIKLVSSADTGFYYVTKKNPRTKTSKLELKKFDPVVRKHVVFKEAKISSIPQFRRGLPESTSSRALGSRHFSAISVRVSPKTSRGAGCRDAERG